MSVLDRPARVSRCLCEATQKEDEFLDRWASIMVDRDALDIVKVRAPNTTAVGGAGDICASSLASAGAMAEFEQ